MKTTNTTTTTTTTATTLQTLHVHAAEMNAAAAAAAITPANFGITPDTAISPAFAHAAAAAAATGDDRAAAALTAAATVYKKMAVAAMARAYLATTHSPMAVYVDTATATAYVGDTAALVAATAGISCTSASRDRLGRTESRLICRESGARRWGKTAAAAYPVDIPAAAAAFPAMDAGKQREHAAARAMGVYSHTPDDVAYYLSSDIITADGVGYTCKSGSGACFAPASALWAAAIHHRDAYAAAALTAAVIIPTRHAAAMGRLHFPRLSAAALYPTQQSAMLVAAAAGMLYRETPHGVRISALHGVIDISFDLD